MSMLEHIETALTRFNHVFRPQAAARRAYYRAQAAQYEQMAGYFTSGGGYEAAGDSRMRDQKSFFRSKSQDEDHHIGGINRSRLRLEGWDQRRNHGLVAGPLRRIADNVVNTGITADAQTSDDAFNAEAEDFWRNYVQTCDLRGRLTLDDMARIAIETRPTDGESFFVKLANGSIQPVEAERVTTPQQFRTDARVVDGFRLNKNGVIMGCYVCPRTDAGTLNKKKHEYVKRSDIIHCARMMRFDQVRGIPDLAPVLNDLRDFRRLHEYTINKAKLDALQGWAIFSKDGGPPRNLRLEHEADGKDSDDKIAEKMEFGRFYHLKEGNDVKSLASTTPNSQYVAFAELILRIISQTLGFTVEFMLLDFKKGSYSANRSAWLANRQQIVMWHDWITRQLLQRVWNWRIAMAIKQREIKPAPLDNNGRSQWSQVRWSIGEMGWVDPNKEITAYRDAWNVCKESLDDLARKEGSTRDLKIKKKQEDIRAAIRAALDIEQEFKERNIRVSWDQIINAGVPGVMTSGQTLSVQAGKDEDDADSD